MTFCLLLIIVFSLLVFNKVIQLVINFIQNHTISNDKTEFQDLLNS